MFPSGYPSIGDSKIDNKNAAYARENPLPRREFEIDEQRLRTFHSIFPAELCTAAYITCPRRERKETARDEFSPLEIGRAKAHVPDPILDEQLERKKRSECSTAIRTLYR